MTFPAGTTSAVIEKVLTSIALRLPQSATVSRLISTVTVAG
jgi:hypothetical protein